MAGHTQQADLFSDIPRDPGLVVINDRCLLRSDGAHHIVLVAGIPITQYAVGDRMAQAHAMVTLVEQGYADQNDVARAFAYAARTLRRHQRRYEDGGLAALGRPGGYPKGRVRLKSSRARQVSHLKAARVSNREIARRMGVSEKAVRKLLRRLGFKEPTPPQLPLPLGNAGADPNLSAFSPSPRENLSDVPVIPADPNLSAFFTDDEPALSLDSDPADRRQDRLLAYLGLLDDATPLFQNVALLPRAGVLLALPALVLSGVFGIARTVYGSLGPAFYGLRTCLVVMLLMALLRIKRPEALKEHCPAELGWMVGLDRAPEVKTLRRKLTRLAALSRATAFGHALAAQRAAERGAAMGFLYVDGHVRVYHGRHTLPKAHVARLRLPMPATTDYWVNDASGDPLFVVTAVANPERRRPTMRGGFKIAHGQLGHEIRAALKRVTALKARRDQTPRRVPVADTVAGEVVKLAPEKKLLTNILKLVAYQAESELVRAVAPHYKRAEDEGRTLITAAFNSTADLEATDSELRVTIAPQSSAHRTKAITALCEELNRTNTVFPGTRLRLRYAIKVKP